MKKKIIGDQLMFEHAAKSNPLLEHETFVELVEQFFSLKEVTDKDKTWKNESDCKSNFVYWIPKELARRKKLVVESKRETEIPNLKLP